MVRERDWGCRLPLCTPPPGQNPATIRYDPMPYLCTFLSYSYETIDGTANADSDYIPKKDVMVFKPDETLKHIDITIIDDNEWEENEIFFVKLSPYDIKDNSVAVGKLSVTEVTIINDDG